MVSTTNTQERILSGINSYFIKSNKLQLELSLQNVTGNFILEQYLVPKSILRFWKTERSLAIKLKKNSAKSLTLLYKFPEVLMRTC